LTEKHPYRFLCESFKQASPAQQLVWCQRNRARGI